MVASRFPFRLHKLNSVADKSIKNPKIRHCDQTGSVKPFRLTKKAMARVGVP